MISLKNPTQYIGLPLILSIFIFAEPALALEPFAATPEENAMCNAVFRSSLDPTGRKNNMHMHHYCDGLRFLDRAYSRMSNKKQMKYNAERSVSGCNYVLRHTSLDYFMRGDVHVVKSKALNLLGRTSESLSELHEALKYKKSEEVAFSLISDAYKKMGNKKKALEVVTEGLRSYPESNNLKKRYTDLGGTQPYPEPFATNKQAGSKEKTENQKFTTEAAPKVIAPSDDVDKIIEQSSENISPPYKEIEKKIGSKDNPFCRFCPDQDSAQLKQQP